MNEDFLFVARVVENHGMVVLAAARDVDIEKRHNTVDIADTLSCYLLCYPESSPHVIVNCSHVGSNAAENIHRSNDVRHKTQIEGGVRSGSDDPFVIVYDCEQELRRKLNGSHPQACLLVQIANDKLLSIMRACLTTYRFPLHTHRLLEKIDHRRLHTNI